MRNSNTRARKKVRNSNIKWGIQTCEHEKWEIQTQSEEFKHARKKSEKFKHKGENQFISPFWSNSHFSSRPQSRAGRPLLYAGPPNYMVNTMDLVGPARADLTCRCAKSEKLKHKVRNWNMVGDKVRNWNVNWEIETCAHEKWEIQT